MSLKILIVEDEHLGMERLARQLRSLEKDIEIVGMAESVAASVQWLQTNPSPDLILLDIDLGDGQSFEIFNHVTIRCHVIFTTSYDEQALHAFQSNNVDYLLKPIRKAELKDSLEKYISSDLFGVNEINEIENLVKSLKRQLVKGFRQRLLAKEGTRIISIEVDHICYFFQDEQRYYLRTRDKKKLQIEHSLDEIELFIDPLDYFRVNAHWIVGRKNVVRSQRRSDGRLLLQVRPGIEKQVIVEEEKLSAFKSWVKRKED